MKLTHCCTTVGLDLGQARDSTAIAVDKSYSREDRSMEHQVIHLERPQLGTPYPKIVERVGLLMARPELAGSRLVVDATGVGAAVVDMLVEAKLNPVRVMITAGERASFSHGSWHVPKRDLAGVLQAALSTQRLKIAKLPLAPVLERELVAFRVKVNIATGHDTYEALREGDHDDIVLALAMAAWYAERVGSAAYKRGDLRPVASDRSDPRVHGGRSITRVKRPDGTVFEFASGGSKR